MIFFLAFLFSIVGILSACFSYFYLLFAIIPLLFIFFRYRDRRLLLLALFIPLFILLAKMPSFIKEGYLDTVGIIFKRKDNYYLLATLKGNFYIKDYDNNLTVLSIVNIKGYSSSLSFSHYESGFDFEGYLNGYNVFKEFKGEKTVLFKSFLDYSKLKDYMFSYVDSKTRTVLSSMLFSDTIYDLEESNVLNSLSLINAFSLSGFHISFLLRSIRTILGRKREKISDILDIIITSLFFILSEFSYSLLRLEILAFLKVLFKKKNLDYLSRVSICAIILLLMFPSSIQLASFFYPFPLLFSLAIFSSKERRKSRLSFFFRIQFFFFPFSLYKNYSISVLSYILQMLILPFSNLIFLLSVFTLIVPQIVYIISPLITFILFLATSLSKIDFTILTGIPSILFVVSYYSFYILYNIIKTYHYKKYKSIPIVCISVITIIQCIPDFSNHYEIAFIDVDQGDSTLIRNNKGNILIDTGGKINTDLANDCLIPFLKKKKIRKLDAVLITHRDYDHYGALESLNKNFQIDNIYYRDDFLLMKENTLSIIGLNIKNYNNYIIEGSYEDEENMKSGVYGFTIKGKSVVIMGDAPSAIESKIIEDYPSFDFDILKVSHHGSSTSSKRDFLSKVSPEITIISVGKNNQYKHPSQMTLDNLNALSIPYRRTDLEGTIIYKF